MKDNLSLDEIQQIKKSFTAWMELQDEKKQLSDAEKDIKQDIAKVIDDKVKRVNLLLKDMKSRYEGEDSDVDEVSMLSELIRNNGEYAEESGLGNIGDE